MTDRRELDLWRRIRSTFDWPLLLVALAIAGLGLVNLYSATRHAPQGGLFARQIWWLSAGFLTFMVVAFLDYRVWQRLSWGLLLVCLIAVVLVHFGGVAAKGSRRWLGWGSWRIQPSEFVKLAFILVLARFVDDRGSGELSWSGIGARVLIFLGAIALIAWQPDLGTAALVTLICLSVAFLAAKKVWPFLVGLGVVGAAAPLLWMYVLQDEDVLHEYQIKRIRTFLDPTSDLSGAGWHARQSIVAVGSGQVTGKGYMHGTQNQLNFLPEQWTDFPFSVWAEEWGFLGSITLLALYVFLLLWIIHVASQSRDRFGATLCVGVGAMVFWHVAVNLAMVTGLAPVVGVTLPLVSYGGSSVLTTFIGLGLVASVSMRRYAR